MSKVGVLALQGDFAEHLDSLKALGVDAREVRLPEHLADLDALILPGGESTTISRLLDLYKITEPLKAFAASGRPVWGTCAGMILMATVIKESPIHPLCLIDVTVWRNAYGRQVDSFEANLSVPRMGQAPFRGVFIRAPVIHRLGPGVEVVAALEDGSPVAALQGKRLVSAFHPELTNDPRFHELFLSLTNHQR